MAETSTREALRAAIQKAGYYPELVADTLEPALADEQVRSYFVHHEPHFDHKDEFRQHASVLVLTPTRLIVGHTDEYPADEDNPVPYATTATETVPLARISSVVISRTVNAPLTYTQGDAARDVVLTVGWGALSRLELEPAGCTDPACDADHGYTGTITVEDFTIRASATADGKQRVNELLAFARALSGATR
jgi:hypothetical protein